MPVARPGKRRLGECVQGKRKEQRFLGEALWHFEEKKKKMLVCLELNKLDKQKRPRSSNALQAKELGFIAK